MRAVITLCVMIGFALSAYAQPVVDQSKQNGSASTITATSQGAQPGSAATPGDAGDSNSLRSRFADKMGLATSDTESPKTQKVRDALEQVEIDALRYDSFSYEHKRDTFQRQGWMTTVVFLVVVMLVMSGLVFSGFQFWIGMKQADKAMARAERLAARLQNESGTGTTRNSGTALAADPTSAPAAPVTQIELSLQGLKVSSPVLGVAILALSMGFFYLYLKYVYPISYAAPPAGQEVSSPITER